MRLSELLPALPQYDVTGQARVEITGLAHDSRRVQPGYLFVALRGRQTDGHRFIPDAVERGAAAVVVEDPASCAPVPTITVPDARLALAHLSAAFHGYPARHLRVIGVTGTDGKTTTVNLIRAILTAAGHKTGMISTVNALIGDRYYDTGLHTTTPDAIAVQGYLARMVAAGSDYAVLEATSHGLAQHRVTACDFDVAVVTNVTHEHLDYHGTYEEYRAAKARLFRHLATSFRKPNVPKIAILNADDASFEHLRSLPCDERVSYGLAAPGEVAVSARRVEASWAGLRFVAVTPHGEFEVRSPLIGDYNVPNMLAAIAVGVSQRVPVEAMQRGIAAVEGVVGRMDVVDAGQDFTAIVDFAHTPHALQRALETARQLATGRVIAVFGCAGRRDVQKRPMMGAVSGRLADFTVITAEDPRTEDVEAIMAEIATGCEKVGCREGEGYVTIGDRGEAIQFAVDMARAGDVVIVCGKGHERSMCFGTTETPWSDHGAVRRALEKRGLL